MAFPEDYQVNPAFCMKKNWGIHKWSTMGHPLTHRCLDCHRPKWVEVDPLKNAER